jgi:hypothetical protein
MQAESRRCSVLAKGAGKVDLARTEAPPFAPGVRLSSVDVIVLVIGTIAAAALALMTWWWGFVVGFVLVHFFLFCNVFRIARSSELVWAAIFVGCVTETILAETPGWIITAVLSLLVTVAVLIVEMRKPSYHGLAWERINPELPVWWQTHGHASDSAKSALEPGGEKARSVSPDNL